MAAGEKNQMGGNKGHGGVLELGKLGLGSRISARVVPGTPG